ncbi:MAG TPA: STAS domain-containing protein [Terriglobales bacterium]|jgi:anti-sigma B factor antagonist|nr:STAS domain-containing protein [Terriglobales bacterium]HET7872683.1 STAS domain-containing protein [Terriglobales bacterium]
MAANPVPVQPRTLEIDFQIPQDGTPTLICRGRITTETSGLFKSEVKKLIPQSKLIVVDLSKVDYIDSSGLGTVLATYVSAKTSGCTLKLVNLNQRIKELLQLTRLASVFEGYGEYL